MENGGETTKRGRGRPKGSRTSTRASLERAKVLAQADIKPLTVLMETMAERWRAAQLLEGEERAKVQSEACAVAEKVAPYLHARLQATTIKGDADAPLSFTVSLPASDALRAMIRGTDSTK